MCHSPLDNAPLGALSKRECTRVPTFFEAKIVRPGSVHRHPYRGLMSQDTNFGWSLNRSCYIHLGNLQRQTDECISNAVEFFFNLSLGNCILFQLRCCTTIVVLLPCRIEFNQSLYILKCIVNILDSKSGIGIVIVMTKQNIFFMI